MLLRENLGSPRLIGVRILLAERGGDYVHPGLRLRDGYTGLQASDGAKKMRAALLGNGRRIIGGFEQRRHGGPQGGRLARDRILKTCGHHTDDGVSVLIEKDRTADDFGIAGKS